MNPTYNTYSPYTCLKIPVHIIVCSLGIFSEPTCDGKGRIRKEKQHNIKRKQSPQVPDYMATGEPDAGAVYDLVYCDFDAAAVAMAERPCPLLGAVPTPHASCGLHRAAERPERPREVAVLRGAYRCGGRVGDLGE